MKDGLKSRLSGVLRRLGALFALLLFQRPACPAPPALRGTTRQAVVVPSPDPRFTEAVFILREEAFREPGVSHADLLRQAKAAAENGTAQALPRSSRRLRPELSFLLGAAAALLVLRLTGLL